MRDRTVLLALALGSLLGVCCAHAAVPPPPEPIVDPFFAEESARTVSVEAVCPPVGLVPLVGHGGSGTAVNGAEVLTAFHVVSCAPIPAPLVDPVPRTYAAPLSILVTLADGRILPATVAAISSADDMAILKVDGTTGLAPVQPFLSPSQGRVCINVARPSRVRRCGIILGLTTSPDMEIHFAQYSEPGNSGGGIFDESGRLVGAVTRVGRDQGGYGTALIPSEWRTP